MVYILAMKDSMTIGKLLLGVSDVNIPLDTLTISVVVFVVTPLLMGAITNKLLVKKKGKDWFEHVFLKKLKLPHCILNPSSMIGASNFWLSALVTVVGVLIEVPVMLSLVKTSNTWRY